MWWAALIHLRGCRMACVAFVWVEHIAVRHSSCLQGRTIVRNNRLPPPKLLPTLILIRQFLKGRGGEDSWGWVSPAARGIPSLPRAGSSARCLLHALHIAGNTRPATEPVKLRSCFETCTELILHPGHRWFARVYTTKHCNLCQQHQPCARCGSS